MCDAQSKTGETETVQRAYTPYSGNAQRGFVDILIKVYFPIPGVAAPGETAAPKPIFEGGKMTMLLDSIDPSFSQDNGMSVELKGPLGHFTYLGNCEIKWKPANAIRKVRKLAMIAGGSGITPIWSTLKAIADEALSPTSAHLDPIQIWIIYGNRTEQDILIREELERLRVALKGNLHVRHVLSNVTPEMTSWTGGRGYIDGACMRDHLPPAPVVSEKEDELEDTLALVCGPPPLEKVVSAGLKELGWDLERNVVFF